MTTAPEGSIDDYQGRTISRGKNQWLQPLLEDWIDEDREVDGRHQQRKNRSGKDAKGSESESESIPTDSTIAACIVIFHSARFAEDRTGSLDRV